MGKSKYLDEINNLFEKSSIVSFKSIERVVKLKNKKSNYAKLLISNLMKSGKIKKIAKGFYTSHEDNSLVVLCYNNSYLGLQSSLSFHDLWEQETIPIIITAEKIRQGMREVLGGNVLIRRTQKKYVFGFEYFEEGGFYLPFSDIEKTFIDMFVFREKISEEVMEKFKERIDKKKLEKYLKKYPKLIKEKVIKAFFEKSK